MPEPQRAPTDAHLRELELNRWKRRGSSTLTLDPEMLPLRHWRKLQREVESCVDCELHRERKNTVFGVGDQNAQLMLVGEAPGADEDAQGEPFVGRAGQLLNSMLKAIGLKREQVYIANILKCRPPHNANPTPEQAHQCRKHLNQQIELIKPKVILALGAIAAQNLLDVQTPIGKLRGQAHALPDSNIFVVPTYHPAYLIRSPRNKAQSFADLMFLCEVMEELPSSSQ